jgi:hypothetical protein
MSSKKRFGPGATPEGKPLTRRTAMQRMAAVGLAGAGMAVLPAGRGLARDILPEAILPRLEDLRLDELGRVVLPEGRQSPLAGQDVRLADKTNVLCTTPGCACPPKNSTCPVNLICGDCPKPPPAPLPECYCPPANSTCTPKG